MDSEGSPLIIFSQITQIQRFCQILLKKEVRVFLQILNHKYNKQFVYVPSNYLAKFIPSLSTFYNYLNDLIELGVVQKEKTTVSAPHLNERNETVEQQLFGKGDPPIRRRSIIRLVSNRFRFDFTKDKSVVYDNKYQKKLSMPEEKVYCLPSLSLSQSLPSLFNYLSKPHGVYFYLLLNTLKEYHLLTETKITYREPMVSKKMVREMKHSFDLPLSSRTLNFKDYQKLSIFNVQYVTDEQGTITLKYGAKYTTIDFEFERTGTRDNFIYKPVSDGFVAIKK